MRVTENTNYETIRDSMRRSRTKMEGLQNQQATLKRVNAPSDDPVGAAKILEMRTDKISNDQFITNTKMATSMLEMTDHALSELSELVVRAKEIALSQASGASSNDASRMGIAEEVTQIYQQAISVANRRIGDRHIFGGYKTNRPPVSPDGRYQGDDGQTMVEIGKDIFLPSNVHGLEAFNTHPESADEPGAQRFTPPPGSLDPNGEPLTQGRGPASISEGYGAKLENVNVFDEIQNLRIGLLSGDLGSIRGTLERLDQLNTKLVATRAMVGSRVQGLQSAAIANEKHNISNAQLNSMLEDADMAQVVSDLAKEETVFRSSLQTSQKLIQPTLLDFLK